MTRPCKGVDVVVAIEPSCVPLARSGNPNAGGLLNNFPRATSFASLCVLRTRLDLLVRGEGLVIEKIYGYGAFFRNGESGQRLLASALNVPVSVPETAGEGGARGMALLAAYMLRVDSTSSLETYLDVNVAHKMGRTIDPDPEDVRGFKEFFNRHEGLAVERAALTRFSVGSRWRARVRGQLVVLK